MVGGKKNVGVIVENTSKIYFPKLHPMDCPSMKVVVQMLKGDGDNLAMPPNPFASTGCACTPARCLNLDLEVIPELE
ncbi:hypothetical protein CFP56_004152 [Quercus suber]|uniref:Uncharacterized protein n=1 Tax=Quercus suber TaxID=58331 RepID=A0AAW0LDB3_QUESU